MSDQPKKAYGLPTLAKRQSQGLPVDITQNDTYLGLITKAQEWKKGGGIQLGITLYNIDGTKVQHQNGGETVEVSAPMPLEGARFFSYTKAIFYEADQFTIDAGFDLEDLLERWVYVKLERDKKRDENEEELAKWGPRLQVSMMTAIPPSEREAIRAMHERVVGQPWKVLTAGGGGAPAQASKPAAKPAQPAAAKPAAKAATPATVPPGVNPDDPFGVGAG